MKKKLFFVFAFLFAAAVTFAQKYPVQWTLNAVKISANTYKINITATIPSPWHLYSQNTPDGGPVPTKFTFSKNPLITLVGKPVEKGTLLVTHDKNFGVDVKYYSNKVEFIQTAKVRGNVKTNLNGTVTFMVCNDRECLPPIDKAISVKLE